MQRILSYPLLLPVIGLGLTQVLGYGTLYYSFPILEPDFARSFGWSSDMTFGVYSLALFFGGIAFSPAGKLIDRHGASRMMMAGSLAVAACLAATALAGNGVVFALFLTLSQIVSATVLYGAAFAALVELDPKRGPQNITFLTMIAGFSSTLFWPFTTALHTILDWRSILLVFALLNLLLCAPIHYALPGRRSKNDPADTEVTQPDPVIGALAPVDRRRGFVMLAIGLSLSGITLSCLLVMMVPLLKRIGFAAEAVPVGMLFGPSQVLSRFVNMVFRGRISPYGLALTASSLITAGVTILMLSGPFLPAALLFAIFGGLGSGILSIVQGSLPLSLFGSEGYGTLTGKLSAWRLAGSALAPFGFAALMENIGVTGALAAAALCGLAGIAALLMLPARRPVTSGSPEPL